MKLLTAQQMKDVDNYAINTLGISSVKLMTSAAYHVAFAATDITKCDRAAIFCGSGNNGGDGIGAAVHLRERGIFSRVFLVGSREKMTADCLEMENRYKALGGEIEDFDADSCDIRDYTENCGVIIDAIFGVGLSRELGGNAAAAVEIINSAGVPVVSADIASGIDADTGKIMGCAVKADVTVTFSCAKPGHFSEPGYFHRGRLKIADIGIPKELYENLHSDFHAIFEEDVSLPRRAPDAHKGTFGRDLIIGGCVGYTGAPLLSSRAAVRTGAGLLYLGVPERIYDTAAVRCLEEMPFPLPCDASGKISLAAREKILEKLDICNACLIGPGLGRSEELTALVSDIISSSKIPLVIDADGINAVSENINVLADAACPIVLTPHVGEFKRLGRDLSSQSRLEAARSFAVLHNCTLVLKGHRTLIAFPDGEVRINTTGNPGMAKGGSGDVLSGIITSFIGQNIPFKDAVSAAVYLHSKAGDMCREKFGEYFMTPSDTIDMLSEATKNITR